MKQETRMSTASRETSAPMLTYARGRFGAVSRNAQAAQVYPICTWAVCHQFNRGIGADVYTPYARGRFAT